MTTRIRPGDRFRYGTGLCDVVGSIDYSVRISGGPPDEIQWATGGCNTIENMAELHRALAIAYPSRLVGFCRVVAVPADEVRVGDVLSDNTSTEVEKVSHIIGGIHIWLRRIDAAVIRDPRDPIPILERIEL